ncbi:MAG: hypothetical protein ABJB16_15400 [Saprospiraceae bacterium]
MNKILIQNFNLRMFWIIALGFFGPSAYSQQMPGMKSDSSLVKKQSIKNMDNMTGMEEEVAHPFFTHMGMPDAVGTYSLRLSALSTQEDGISKGDFGFHLETGLTKMVGLHLRNDRVLTNAHTEIMFQFAVLASKNGMNGFSPLIEFEIPTHKGEKAINTLVGFSTMLSNSHIAFNQAIHYSPREDLVEGSASLVYKIYKNIFLVGEIQGEKLAGESIALNLVGGVKVKINNYLIIGLGYQAPITDNKDFSSQYILQPNFEWKN